MTEVMLARSRILSGKETQLRAWFKEMKVREQEVVETLQHENVFTETAFIQTTPDGKYLYVYMEAENLEKADDAGDEEKYRIDEQHHETLKETLTGDWERLDTIGHFSNPAR